jgi:C-terminal processing protease CtpA/Prc
MAWFEKRAGVPTLGLLGSEALLNYRIGLDYARSTVYFDIGSTFKFPDFNVIGLVLRPEDDTRFTVLGVAEFEGKPSVPEVQPGDQLLAVDSTPVPDSTMGQVWSMLEGQSGQERKLTLERAGKQFIVVAKVQQFLAEAPDKEESKKKSKRN